MILVAPNHIESGTGRIIGRETAAEQGADSGKYLANAGQIIYSKIRPTLSKVTIAVEKCLCSADMYAMSFRPAVLPRYALYYMLARPFHSYTTVTSMRVKMPKINRDELAAAPWLVPPLEEQRTIAEFLDHETAQIDALVSKQEEFVTLLRERRSVVVSEILSRTQEGGNPPDQLHRRTHMGNGSTPRSGEDRYWLGGEIPWVNSSVVNLSEVREPSRRVTKAAVLDCHLPIVRPGSILVALTGQGKTRGAATILRIESTINQHLAYIEPDERYWVPEYLLWSLRSNYEYLRRISSENGATKGGLTVADLRALRLAMPPIHEQRQLLAEVAAATERVDSLVAKAQEHIAFAKERRAALITAVVTGQLDVRTARKAG
ncbi:restriction endonuclease subunit S [Streptomyces sp. NPDC002599]|uniref:restriction endonuclease subunit S n=1 Tax=Streptomyces sp. NPDC002599 TaxID=3154421 RepID=UPI003321BC03